MKKPFVDEQRQHYKANDRLPGLLAELFVVGPQTMILFLLCPQMHTKTHSLPQIIIHSDTHWHMNTEKHFNLFFFKVRRSTIFLVLLPMAAMTSTHFVWTTFSLDNIYPQSLRKHVELQVWTHRAGPNLNHINLYDWFCRADQVLTACNWAGYSALWVTIYLDLVPLFPHM